MYSYVYAFECTIMSSHKGPYVCKNETSCKIVKDALARYIKFLLLPSTPLVPKGLYYAQWTYDNVGTKSYWEVDGIAPCTKEGEVLDDAIRHEIAFINEAADGSECKLLVPMLESLLLRSSTCDHIEEKKAHPYCTILHNY